MSGLAVKAMGSLGDAASYFDHEMTQDEERDAPAQEREPAIETEQEAARQQVLDAERLQREAETRERDAREAQDREAEARRDPERDSEREREAAQERVRAERDRQPDTSWQSSGVHATDEGREPSASPSMVRHDDDDPWTQPIQIRAGGESAEQIWSAQDRFERADVAALWADLREQYVNLGLTGSLADERLEKLEEMVEQAAKLGERITISRDEFSGELVWTVHNADREFGSDLERLQFLDRLKELEHLAAEYGVAFVRHDGPELERVEFSRAPSLREQSLERAGGGMDFGLDR